MSRFTFPGKFPKERKLGFVPPRYKKLSDRELVERRKMMSKSRGSLGIGNLIFWGFLAYLFFGGGGDDEADKATKTANVQEETTITETLKETGSTLSKEATKIYDVVKKEVHEYTKDEPPLAEQEKEEEKIVVRNDDPYAEIEDKWGSETKY